MRRIAGLAVVAAAIALWAGDAAASALVYCAEGSPSGFDPARHTDPATLDASSQAVYDRLVRFAPGTATIVPGLAESWEISPDGLEYTFHLRPGVRFQGTGDYTPARPLNADDVVFSFERQWREDNPWYDAAPDGWPWFAGLAMPFVLRDVRKLDDLTVRFVLERPHAPFLADLAMDFASILSKEYADRLLAAGNPEALDTAPVGTGPFRLVEHVEGALVRYAANPDYWAGRPPVDDLIFDVTPDPGVRFEKLKSGECQVIPSPNAADLAAIRAEPGLALLEGPGLALAFIAFNTTRPPFDRARARKAVAAAIDRGALAAEVFGGAAAPTATLLSPLMLGGATAPPPAFDADKARQAVAEAEAAGAALPLWSLAAARPYDPDPARMAAMLRDDLAAAGLETKVVTPSADAFFADSVSPDRDGAVLLGWVSDNGDPDNLLAPLLGCDAVGISNRANWCDPRFDALLAEARATHDPEARARLYARADRLAADEIPLIPLLYAGQAVATRDTVAGYVVDPFGRHNFATVAIVPPAN
ncbi:MAG: ABC transporter substrate-binding protein [Rhizobiales bacterium]|nr:ABC transporter substrate-binding protein [Hyphomicrobiales bacterium]